jgi:hypothetical protein
LLSIPGLIGRISLLKGAALRAFLADLPPLRRELFSTIFLLKLINKLFVIFNDINFVKARL